MIYQKSVQNRWGDGKFQQTQTTKVNQAEILEMRNTL